MNKLLIIVDMQNDFIDGALANPEAQKIVSGIVEKIEEWDGPILLTMDTHEKETYLNSMEGKYLPIAHCIKGTEGWLINPEIDKAVDDHGFYFDIMKPTFGYKDWTSVLKNIPDIDEICLCGTCTDICVISNALILKAMFPEMPVKVFGNLCAGLTPEKHQAALNVMQSCQVEVIND